MSETITTPPEILITASGFELQKTDTQLTAYLTPSAIQPISDAEAVAGAPDASLMVSDVFETINAVERRPRLWGALGFSVEKNEEGYVVKSPSNTTLNELRAQIPASVGLNTAEFVDLPTPNPEEDGGQFGAKEFITMFAQGKIPMAVHDPLITHDNFSHRLGYAMMSDVIFKRLQAAAQKALATDDLKMMQKLTGAIDAISATQSPFLGLKYDTTGAMLGVEYREFMLPIIAGARALKDRRAQMSTARRLLAYVGEDG